MRPPDEPIEGEIVDAPASALPRRASYFHPLSGMVILGLDWLAFGLDFFSGFVALAVVSALTFAATFALVSSIQSKLHGDPPKTAAWKAFLGALAAGVPFPITGTIVGAAILALSGLPRLGRRQ
ncbi:MAG: hypothetical protein HY077_01775 [Elusimicrobia bacterium]|nr:hypothetical protein [Elusimicrobiota bacterium]